MVHLVFSTLSVAYKPYISGLNQSSVFLQHLFFALFFSMRLWVLPIFLVSMRESNHHSNHEVVHLFFSVDFSEICHKFMYIFSSYTE
jgi:hypothetical protein